MSPRRVSLRILVCAAALLAVGIADAAAPSYPNKPIRFLVGFAPGSSTDVMARIVANHVSKKLGQPVIVDNRTGANGMLAAAELSRAEPAYTVLISNSSTITLNPLLYKKLQYDIKDFAPVSLMVAQPFLVLINPDNERTASVSSLPDLVKLARNKPDVLTFGSAGLGNVTQLCFELLNSMAGVKMVHVPYRGTGPMRVALLAKEVDTAVDALTAMPQVKAGKLKVLAVTSRQRLRELPDVPSIAELGYAGYDMGGWAGAVVHTQTPPAAVKILYDAIRSAGEDPVTRALLEAQGNVLMLDPQQFAARIKAETQQNGDLIKRANISQLE